MRNERHLTKDRPAREERVQEVSGTKSRLLQVGAPVVAVLIATGLMMRYARQAEFDRLSIDFNGKAQNISNGLIEVIDVHQETVWSVESLHASHEGMRRSEFNTFVERAIKRHPGIQALEWIPRVPPELRSDFEVAARKDGLDNYVFKEWTPEGKWVPATESDDDYFPVYYMRPHEGNEAALGIDLASNPTRLRALVQARDTGRPVATARITLAQESGTQAGFLLFVPVYRSGAETGSVVQRRASLEGFALGVFRLDDMVSAVLAKRSMQGVSFRILDITDAVDDAVLFESDTNDLAETPFLASVPHDVGGRQWRLEFSAGPAYVAARRSSNEWLIALGGLLFAPLLGVFLNSITERAKNIEALVVQRTAELRDATIAANASNAAKSQFLSNMSHEIRTPLTAILGFVDLLAEEDVTTDSGHERVETIRRNGNHLSTLINDILDLSKIDAGQLDVEQIETAIPTVVTDVLNLLGEREREGTGTDRDRDDTRSGTHHYRPHSPAPDSCEPCWERDQIHKTWIGHTPTVVSARANV